jgi:type II secretory pathway pseudopilin PulG
MNVRSESKREGGFTLVELILYVALVGIFLTGAVRFGWEVVYGREKYQTQAVVEQEIQVILERLKLEIKKGRGYVVGAGLIEIQTEEATSPVVIRLNSEALEMSQAGGTFERLSSNQVKVMEFGVSETGSSTNDSRGINIKLGIKQADNWAKGGMIKEITKEIYIEELGGFNQARKLLIDSNGASLNNGGREVAGMEIKSLKVGETMVIDKLEINWSGGQAGAALTGVKISGVNVWSGNATSGTTVDLVDVSIGVGVTIDKLSFSDAMGESKIGLNWIMGDGSKLKAELMPAAGTTTTPTPTLVLTVTPTLWPTIIPTTIPTLTPTFTPAPTLTPTPTIIPSPTLAPINCSQYCSQRYGLGGSCQKSCGGINGGKIYECKGSLACCCQ